MTSLSPNIFTHNMVGTIDFYTQLGFKIIMSVPEQGDTLDWVMMKNGNVSFMFQSFENLKNELPEINRTPGASLLFYINIENIQHFFNSINSKIPILKGLEKTFYGATEFSVIDNNGLILTFAEHI